MGKKLNWSWTSALIGAATATASTAIISAKPKVPKFRIVSLTALQLKLTHTSRGSGSGSGSAHNEDELKFPRLEADLILTVHVTNPNLLPVQYSATSLSIYYNGSLFGSAQVPAGIHPPKSCQLLRLPARLDGRQLAHHSKRFIEDVSRRKMILDAEVDIRGWVKAILWDPKINIHVDSRIVVDPLMLDVVDQENECRMRFFVK